MSSTGILRLFATSTSRCVCLLPPRVIGPSPPALTLLPAARIHIKKMPNSTIRVRHPPKKKRPNKQERRQLRPANITKLSDVNIIESRKARGGGSKQWAVTMATSNFALDSVGVSDECRIHDVVTVGRDPIEHLEEKILRRGYCIEIDATPFQGKFTANHLLEGCDTSDVSDDIMTRFHETVGSGRVFARILSQPGQEGNCNGVVCEGANLSRLLNTLTLVETQRRLELEAEEAEGEAV